MNAMSRFSLAMENHNTPGYVSEKLLLAFLWGGIPIYYGARRAVHLGSRLVSSRLVSTRLVSCPVLSCPVLSSPLLSSPLLSCPLLPYSLLSSSLLSSSLLSSVGSRSIYYAPRGAPAIPSTAAT